MRLVELLTSSESHDRKRSTSLMLDKDFNWRFRNFYLSRYMKHEASTSASMYSEIMDSGVESGQEIEQRINLGEFGGFFALYLYIYSTYKERVEKYEIGGPKTSPTGGLTFEASNFSLWEFTKNGMERTYSSGLVVRFEFGFAAMV